MSFFEVLTEGGAAVYLEFIVAAGLLFRPVFYLSSGLVR